MIKSSSNRVAVLIPTFKPAWYIERCLFSINSQTLSKSSFTVYIALNGDKDPYWRYIKNVVESLDFDARIFYLDRAGVSAARNYLIEKSHEPFICFVDDDDVLSDNYLEALLNCSDVDSIGVSNVKTFTQDIESSKVNYIGNFYYALSQEESSLFKARKYFSSPCAKIIHRDMVGPVRFDSRLVKGEDALFMAEISPNVAFINKPKTEAVYYVYERPGSATRSRINKKDELSRIFYLLKKYLRMLLFKEYNKLFLLSRLGATLMHIKGVFSLPQSLRK